MSTLSMLTNNRRFWQLILALGLALGLMTALTIMTGRTALAAPPAPTPTPEPVVTSTFHITREISSTESVTYTGTITHEARNMFQITNMSGTVLVTGIIDSLVWEEAVLKAKELNVEPAQWLFDHLGSYNALVMNDQNKVDAFMGAFGTRDERPYRLTFKTQDKWLEPNELSPMVIAMTDLGRYGDTNGDGSKTWEDPYLHNTQD